MGWTTPRTWVTSEVVSATLMNAHVRDNLAYLLAPPADLAQPTGVAYTVTSTSYVDLDATGLNLAVTPASGRVLLGLNMAASGNASLSMGLRVQVDGGASYVYWGDNHLVGVQPVLIPTPPILLTGLTVAQHTFKLQVKVTGNTLTIYRAADGTLPIRFWVMEV